MTKQFEAVVVGAGPAGMAAALALTKHGAKTAVVDDGETPGGQVYRSIPRAFKEVSAKVLSYRQRTGRRLTRAILQPNKKLTYLTQSSVWGAFEPHRLNLVSNHQVSELAYQKLILCEGANERFIPFPGWTLPGVMSIGGIQTLLRRQRIVPGKRVLLAGTGPLLIAAAAELIQAGTNVVGVLEAVRFQELIPLAAEMFRQKGLIEDSIVHLVPLLKKRGIFHPHRCLVEAHGKDRLEAATICELTHDWRPIWATKKIVKIDTLGIGFGLKPGARISRLCGCTHHFDRQKGGFVPALDSYQASDKAGIYVAGDSAGIGGARMAEIQGEIAGLHVAYSLDHISRRQFERRIQPLLKSKKKVAKYARKLVQIHTPRDAIYQTITPDTVVCRCEGVTAGEICDQIQKGRLDLTSLKVTRLGMGPCQGRGCESIAAELLRLYGVDAHSITPLRLRPPLIPIPILAFEKSSNEAIVVNSQQV